MNWRDLNINTGGRTSGELKTECPNCQHTRTKHKHDKPLSVNLDKGLWRCHHCEWSGSLEDGARRLHTRRIYTRPNYKPTDEPLADKTLEWFAKRGIPAEIVKRHRVERRTIWTEANPETRVIAFPYFRDGEIVNVKYRTCDKKFSLEKGAELILYGLDDVTPESPLLIVEGELDKLAFEVAGFTNCVSVPNGSGTNLDILASCEAWLQDIKKIIWAGDNDEAGKKLEREAIRRLGKERCWRVEWPEGCKDANDVLMAHGPEVLCGCVEQARPVPIEGVFEVVDVLPDLLHIYENGRPDGLQTGWDNLSQYYRPRLGKNTIVTGIPQSGKSAFIRALLVNLAWQYDWKFAVFPPEDLPPEEYISQLAELYVGLPFDEGYHTRMSPSQLQEASVWIQEHFVVLSPVEDDAGPDALFKLFATQILRRGVNGLVIDPFNEIEHEFGVGQTETQYISAFLRKWNRFIRHHNVHGWIIAHPRIIAKDSEEKYPVVTPYQINGGANWYNKADFILSVWRDLKDKDRPVEIHVQKVKHRWCGAPGMAELYFDWLTGRYSEIRNTFRLPEKKVLPNVEEWTL